MSFEIYIKESILNEYNERAANPTDVITIPLLQVVDGLLKIGNNYLPLSNVLYIKELI